MSDPDYTHGLWGEFKRSVAYTRRLFLPLAEVCGLVGFLFILFIFLRPPMHGPLWPSREMQRGQQAHSIGLAMFQYANDNDGKYPDGKSSTEVFQKLLDGRYVTDPALFYIPFAGKIKPVSGQKLKPENVCWDVTSGVDSSAPDSLPLVFLTGYKVTYAPGGAAVPIIKHYPPFTRSWTQWWDRAPAPSDLEGIAVFYKGNDAAWLPEHPNGSILNFPNFVPPTFDAKGKTYRQLTPDGTLAP